METPKLEVDALRVDGFATVAAEPRRAGTVIGNAATKITNCTFGDCTDVTSCGMPYP